MSLKTNYKQLYFKTEELYKRFKPSLTTYFDVFINGSFGKASNQEINFLAYEAVLPGTSYETGQVFGDRQGITEQYPIKRVYPSVDVSFYVDHDYEVIEFFEQWIRKISPNLGTDGRKDSYVKFSYPNTYETDIIITKFERNFRSKSERLSNIEPKMPANRIEYTLLNAYPINVISMPVAYGQSDLLRTTITFNYDLYRFKRFYAGKTTETLFDGKEDDSVQDYDYDRASEVALSDGSGYVSSQQPPFPYGT